MSRRFRNGCRTFYFKELAGLLGDIHAALAESADSELDWETFKKSFDVVYRIFRAFNLMLITYPPGVSSAGSRRGGDGVVLSLNRAIRKVRLPDIAPPPNIR